MEMKRNIIAVLAIVMVLCCVTLAACNDKNETNVLDSYIFEMDGTTVTDDFTLPATIGGEAAEWTSENPAIQLQKRDTDWLAKVTLPETDAVEVKLNVTVKKASKSYTVRVKALDVYDFMNNYVFPKDKATIVDNFDLETEFTYRGKTATIAWSVDEDYELYIKVINNGATLQVTPQGNQTPVKVKATFTYGGVSASQSYRMTVYKTMEGLELVNYWYTNTGVSVELSGYVVAIARAYSDQYKNMSFYIIDVNEKDGFTAGYYIYNVKSTAEQAETVKPGVHVTVKGTTNTNYNGLFETNGGGTFVVNDDVAPIDVNAHVKAIDEEVIGNLPATVYHESRLVSLTNWKVDSVAKDSDKQAGANYTLMTLKKGDAKVEVRVSKYLEGAYATKADDATWTAINALTTTYPVGSMVNVTGILSNYKGWQIMPLSASAVTASDKTEDAAGTVYAGAKVAAAIAKVNEKLVEDKINDKDGKTVRITTKKEFALETAVDGVEISYEIVGKSNAIVLDGGKMTVTPGNPETATILATYKSGEFESVQFFFVESLIPTAASMLEDLEVPDSITSETALPTLEGVTIEWSVESGKNAISIVDGKLVPAIVEVNTPTTIKATITYNEVTRSKNYIVLVQAPVTFIKTALNAAEALNDKATTEKSYILIGTVESIKDAYSEQYKNVSFYLSDGAYKVLVFRYNLDDAATIKAGDKLAIAAKMSKFGTTLEAVSKFVKLDVTDLATAKQAGLDGTGKEGTVMYGRIKSIDAEYSSSFNNITVTITDGTTDYSCYRLKGGADLNVGDYILVTGTPSSFKSNPQVAAGATYIKDAIYVPKQTLQPELATDMKAGTYKLTMDTTPKGGKVLYATGELNSNGALVTSEDATKAVDVVVEAVEGKENVYTLKIGGKYLTGYLNGTYNNMKLVDTIEEAGEWTWNATIKTFTCTFNDKNNVETEFYFGAYWNTKYSSVGNTMALSAVSYISGDKAANIGVTQFVGFACTLKEVEE